MNHKDEKITQPEQEPFQVDEFRPEDTEGLVSLFRDVYGEGYPIRLFYDPEAIIAANRDGLSVCGNGSRSGADAG